jgi:hypothetical protein
MASVALPISGRGSSGGPEEPNREEVTMLEPVDPVLLPLEEFEALVSKVNQAFERDAAALIVGRLGAREIEVFDPQRAGFGGEWSRLRPVVLQLDQLLVLAFEAAPEEVVSEWAAEYSNGSSDEDLGDDVNRRVEILRTNAPALQRVWEAKSRSVLPGLGLPMYRVVREVGVGPSPPAQVLLSLALSPARLNDSPAPVAETTLELTRSDVALLQHILGEVIEKLDGAPSDGRSRW